VDISIWLGIAFFVLSIPMGIATNMLTPRLVAYLEKRKLVKSNRTKEQDIAAYRSIEAFKNGTRDKYVTYIGLAVLSTFFAIGGYTCVVLWVLRVLWYGDMRATTTLPDHLPSLFLGFLAGALFVLSLVLLLIIAATARRIERFDEYTAELQKKWGADVV
jgi:SNF family Na+-dependent transporter